MDRRSLGSLANRPRLLLADEPTGNLDSKNGAAIMNILDLLNREGKTIIIITHDVEVAGHARRIISIRDGQIESDQSNEDIQKPVSSHSRVAAQ